MSSIDLGVYTSDSTSLESFIAIASKIGLAGLATKETTGPVIKWDGDFSVLRRVDITGRGLSSIKNQVRKTRKTATILAVPLTTVEIANWAAGDNRIDLLTLDPTKKHRLRDSTARLAASTGTHLEIQFSSLLETVGLTRSKAIKMFREAVEIGIHSGMSIVISSGAKHPHQMRSAIAMQHIAMLLGMDSKLAETVVCTTPFKILETNKKKIGPRHVAEGIEIIVGGNDEKDS